jgi:predicted metal-dependent enzyme (double-stranded beta helix superfamily)
VRRRPLDPGDFYTLLPPRDDIHRVRTASPDTSVSIHLLANDTGCVLRHTYDEQTGEVNPFRSGYVNAECFDDNQATNAERNGLTAHARPKSQTSSGGPTAR